MSIDRVESTKEYKFLVLNIARITLWVLVLLWMALIFWFSSAGHEVSSGQSTGVVYAVRDTIGVTPPEYLVRKFAHITLYSILGVLVCLLAVQYRRQWCTVWLLTTLVVMLYASSDEIHQIFTGGRTAMVGDVILDTVAGAASALILIAVLRRHQLEIDEVDES